VVLSRDRENGDEIEAAPGADADLVFVRLVAHRLDVYAFAPSAGALQWEHDAEADLIADAVLVALQDWVVEQKALKWVYVSGRMLSPEEMQGETAEALPVSGYRIQVRVGRGVWRKEYDGDLTYTTAEIDSVVIDAEASIDGENYEEID
jgi:hypothetical protein